jgi:endonuclease/exonuclease/phosphatase family metal-dependent hydrolase
MTRIILFLFLLSFIEASGQKKQTAPFRVMTYNIRNSEALDSSNGWEYRKDRMVAQIKYHHPDLLGVQEALPNQLKELQDNLQEYAWYGVGRNEGQKLNEFSAIFYRKSRYQKLDAGTFWLSETPDKPKSKSWDAAMPRVCSWIKMKDLQTGKIFFHFNTHFDHKGKEARKKSALLIVQRINSIAGKSPVLLTGDFNCYNNSEPYHAIVQDTGIQDAQLISQTPHFGPAGTQITFYVKDPIKGKIDFIFVNKSIRVLQHAILSDQMEERYLSDHLPVVAELDCL